jgi:Putative auto-transporter adhesin, head GIN domain
MNRLPNFAACLLLLPGAALAATRTYEVGAFESVSAAAGVDVQITLGPSRSVVAETGSDSFDDLLVEATGNELKISRPNRGWFMFRRPNYKVRVVTPQLRAVLASSGADVEVKGPIVGDFTVNSSSGSDVQVAQIQGGNVQARASSGSDLEIAGLCASLDAEASSGSDLDARSLRCEAVTVQAASGSDVSVWASRSVTGKATSGADVSISGGPPVVRVDKSSGADVNVGN